GFSLPNNLAALSFVRTMLLGFSKTASLLPVISGKSKISRKVVSTVNNVGKKTFLSPLFNEYFVDQRTRVKFLISGNSLFMVGPIGDMDNATFCEETMPGNFCTSFNLNIFFE